MPADDLSEVAELHPLVIEAEGAANHMNNMRAYPNEYTSEVRNRLQAGFSQRLTTSRRSSFAAAISGHSLARPSTTRTSL